MYILTCLSIIYSILLCINELTYLLPKAQLEEIFKNNYIHDESKMDNDSNNKNDDDEDNDVDEQTQKNENKKIDNNFDDDNKSINSLSSNITKKNNNSYNNDNTNHQYKTEFIDTSFLSVTTNLQVAIENPKFSVDYRYHITTALELKSLSTEKFKGIYLSL
jgi:spore germination protein GerM